MRPSKGEWLITRLGIGILHFHGKHKSTEAILHDVGRRGGADDDSVSIGGAIRECFFLLYLHQCLFQTHHRYNFNLRSLEKKKGYQNDKEIYKETLYFFSCSEFQVFNYGETAIFSHQNHPLSLSDSVVRLVRFAVVRKPIVRGLWLQECLHFRIAAGLFLSLG